MEKIKNNLSLITEIFFYVFFGILVLSQIKLFYNSIMTLVLVILVLVLGILYFVFDKSKKRMKHLLYLSGYFLLLGVYFFISHLYHKDFYSLVPGNFNYSFSSELLYFIKMSMPVILLIVFSNLNISKKHYFKVIYGTILFFSLTIIITNLLSISYGSYSDEVIKGNFFSWFTNGYQLHTFYHLASKGFFYSANQVSAILLLFLPITFYQMIKKVDFKMFLLLFIQLWAMFLLGTKTAIFGSVLVIFVMIVMGLFYTFVKKEITFSKQNLLYVNLLLLFWVIIFPFSPIHSRNEVQTIINQDGIALSMIDKEDIRMMEDKISYIEENYKQKRIHDQFILKSYPYTYDPDFWYDILNLSVELRTDYRYLEKRMLDRVVETNNNPFDKWLGISYTRVQNIFNLEQDFLVQYYSVGIIGTILLLNSYFIIIFKSIFGIIKKKLDECYLPLSILCGSCVFLAVSYFSGNLLNSLMVVPYLCLVLGLLNKKIRSE